MNCFNHPDIAAAGACSRCGNHFCNDCLVQFDGKSYCVADFNKAFVKYSPQNKKTPAPPIPVNIVPYGAGKSKYVTLVLCLVFGWLGVHRFYVGRMNSALLFLFTFGLLGLGVLSDLIAIILGKFRDSVGNPLL